MATAWLLTLPAAALVAGALYFVTEEIGMEIAGPLVVCILATLAAAGLFFQAQRSSPLTAKVFVEVEGQRAPATRRAVGALYFGLCLALVAFGICVMFTSK